MAVITGFAASALPSRCVRHSARKTPQCSLSRREVLSLASLAVGATLFPSAVLAESTYEKNVRQNVAKVKTGMQKAQALKLTVATWKESLEEDDEFYVLRFMAIWLEPARVAMAKVGDQTEVDVGGSAAVQKEAAQVMGHLFELRAEAKGRRRAGVTRELDEFVESCEAFFNMPGIKRFVR